MRKLVGFIGFVFSLAWIGLFILITHEQMFEMIKTIFEDPNSYTNVLSSFMLTYGFILFLPLITLLLSVIAMGKYSSKR